MTPVRYLRVRDAELSVRVANCLCKKFGEDVTMGDLFDTYTDLDLLNAGIGRKGLKEVREIIELARVNGDFEPTSRGEPPPAYEPYSTRGTKTLRDEFAMAALTGLISHFGNGEHDLQADAFLIADAMMAARK